VRWLIGPGLIIVGAGLLSMRGLNAQSSWTHLVPGLLAAGLDVSVVQPIHAGMASGISNTFRQVGLATGIGLLGTLFASQVKSQAIAGASQVPALAPRRGQIAAAVQSGTVGKLIAQLPAGARPAAESVARTAFTAGLNQSLRSSRFARGLRTLPAPVFLPARARTLVSADVEFVLVSAD
jgi:hypothetical protein